MKKKLSILAGIALVGLALFSYEMWGQLGPVSRDPNIGAGLLVLLSIPMVVFGILGFGLELGNR